MSSVNDTKLVPGAKEVAIYLGITTLFAGALGGIFNIIVFLSLKTFRQNSCAVFLTVMSFVNIGQLLSSLLSRIMMNGFDADWTQYSLPFCKFRNYCLQVCALVSYSCMCFATIDQFLATSLHGHWQQFFNVKRAQVLCVSFFIIWLLHGIPTLIFYNLDSVSTTDSATCMITNPTFSNYIAYGYVLLLTGIVPIFVTVLFGFLAHRNVTQIPFRAVPLVRRELDKQLTSMVLVEVVYNVLVIIPYIICVFLYYDLNLQATSDASTYLGLAYEITIIVYYLYFASPFYIYVCVSKRFRQQFVYVLTGIYHKWWKHEPHPNNRVSPEGDEV